MIIYFNNLFYEIFLFPFIGFNIIIFILSFIIVLFPLGFIELCNSSTDFHFPEVDIQIQSIIYI